MSSLMFHLLIFDSLYNKALIQYLISLYGQIVLSNGVMPGTEKYFIHYDFLNRYIIPKLELMYHKSCVGNTKCFYFDNEIKEYISVIICQLHNINNDKIQKVLFILLLHESSRYILCGCFMSAYCLFVTSSLTPVYLEG